jgi:hypothetical protein
MSPIRLTASQWIEKYRRGAAIMVDGRRHVAAHERYTGESACVEVEVEDPDARCALVDGKLDAADMARVLTGFRGRPLRVRSAMRYVRDCADGEGTVYVFDERTGMVYILD